MVRIRVGLGIRVWVRVRCRQRTCFCFSSLQGKPNSKEKTRAENVTRDDDHQNAINTTPAQSVDDLLQLDDAVAAMPDVISLQPDPVSQVSVKCL